MNKLNDEFIKIDILASKINELIKDVTEDDILCFLVYLFSQFQNENYF